MGVHARVVAALVFVGCTLGCGSQGGVRSHDTDNASDGTVSSGEYGASSGSLALSEAKQRLSGFEQKQLQLEPLLEKAEADRSALIGKLREMGVTSVTDLKNNAEAQRLAASVQKVASEIRGLQQQRLSLDAAIIDAKTVIRRMEREAAGISDDEMRRLSEQLRDVVDRTDPAAMPVTPLDVDVALSEAIRLTPKAASLSPQEASRTLIGKWEVVEGEVKGTATFTTGGNIIFTWWHESLGKNWSETGTYAVATKRLTIKGAGDYGQASERELEFLSEDEVLINKPQGLGMSWLFGRLKRVNR